MKVDMRAGDQLHSACSPPVRRFHPDAPATERTRPSLVKRCRISPTISPPAAGTRTIQYQGKVPAWLCRWATSSVP